METISLPRSPADVIVLFNQIQDYVVKKYFDRIAVSALYLTFGAVFFYFGLQKPAPVTSPPRLFVGAFVTKFGIPTGAAMLFIGFYEMALGMLFFMRRIRLVFWPFLAHQAVTLLTLVVIPYIAFQPPWLTIASVDIPWALGSFAAFVLKNLIFVAAFFLLASYELGDGPDRDSTR